MKSIKFLVLLQLLHLSTCKARLQERFGWKQIDYDFVCPEARERAIASGAFIPENNLPMGIEVWRDKLFITIIRWRPGIPSSLNYVNLNDNSTSSPKLKPYPNWSAHSDTSGRRQIIAPFRIRADRCDRLWVLDSGKYVNDDKESIKLGPAFMVYDLNTDVLLRRYQFPEDHSTPKSGYANIVVEDNDCDDTYVYAGDAGDGGLVVYSWKKNESWRITHPYFLSDPTASDFDVNGHKFRWSDTIFGIAISKPNANNYCTLYFHPMTSFNEFSVSTEYLRSKSVAESNSNAFKKLGSRGPRTQSASSFLDKKSGVLFYTLVNLNAIGCWRSTNEEYKTENQGLVFANNDTMIYPGDIKVDYSDNLWVVSNKMPVWRYGSISPDEVNFRVFSGSVPEVISHTACDV